MSKRGRKRGGGGMRLVQRDLFGRKKILRMDNDDMSIEDLEQPDSRDKPANDGWHKKPFGAIVIGVTVGLLVILIGAALHHFFPKLFLQGN